jgi:uncharacterized protein (DUF1778 family)
MPARAKLQRTARFNVRVSDKEAQLIRMGAEHRGVNITNFILESACVRAEQEIADSRQFELRPSAWHKFTEALDRPATAKPRLKKLFGESTLVERS